MVSRLINKTEEKHIIVTTTKKIKKKTKMYNLQALKKTSIMLRLISVSMFYSNSIHAALHGCFFYWVSYVTEN